MRATRITAVAAALAGLVDLVGLLGLLGLLGLMPLCGCHHANEVWVYTSMYKEVIAEMKPLLARDLPDIEVRWYQGGSENVAARVSTEMFAGRTQADLILTSDPFWYLELKKTGRLQAYDSPAAREVPREYSDPDHCFTTVRTCLMVIGVNGDAVPESEWPSSWASLRDPAWRKRVSMPSPLESGTTFTATAMLARAFGWDLFRDLRLSEVISAGGNGSVINRMETRERPVGMVLLENIIKARAKHSPVRAVYPSDGAIAVPSPIALTRDADSRHPELARRVYDWFFTDQAQKAIVHGAMYSPIPRLAPPEGATPWTQLKLMKWDAQVAEEIYGQRAAIKSRFSEVVLK